MCIEHSGVFVDELLRHMNFPQAGLPAEGFEAGIGHGEVIAGGRNGVLAVVLEPIHGPWHMQGRRHQNRPVALAKALSVGAGFGFGVEGLGLQERIRCWHAQLEC